MIGRHPGVPGQLGVEGPQGRRVRTPVLRTHLGAGAGAGANTNYIQEIQS